MEDTDLSQIFFVGTVKCEEKPEFQIFSVKDDKWIAPLQIHGNIYRLKLDTYKSKSD